MRARLGCQPRTTGLGGGVACLGDAASGTRPAGPLNRPHKPMRPGEERLGEIVETVAALKVHAPETSALLANAFGSMLHGPAMKSFKGMDARFVVRDACKGCGTCVKVCPRDNVRLENGRPAFTHNCELCHACIQWCPQFAIRHPGFDTNPRQYRNPAVRISDLV